MIHDEGHSTIGIVCLNNRKVTANKYSTTQQTIEDEGHSTIGVVCLNGNYVEAEIYSESKYGNVCDSHGIFVSNITSSQATITDVNQNE
jgi:isoaspartyl peptidase/L-asparaginase-like protein (Ntn-hydrolase superfamily)